MGLDLNLGDDDFRAHLRQVSGEPGVLVAQLRQSAGRWVDLLQVLQAAYLHLS